MEMIKNEQIYAFDSLYTTNHIQMLKILLPCLNPPLQKNLALYIKFLELRYTISFLSTHPYVISGCGFDRERRGQDIPLNELLPYLTPQEAENFRQLQKSMDMMKQFSGIQKNMEALKGILPEGMDFDALFQGMMGGFGDTPERSAPFAADTAGSTSGTDAEASPDAQNSPFPANGILRNMMKGSPGGDVLKNMMSDSQKELYEKFNERFQNI
ncbi:MAG: hypothetical protein HFI10_03125 [Lachnospiraceae bacterium]|jgi:hypothetical protein|nr:hypothetical protein [Lachnospiraceae bacterium]